MLNIWRKLLITTGLLAACVDSHALATIEIEKGVERGVPIAVIPFGVDGRMKLEHIVDDVIRNNLARARRFDPIPAIKFLSFPTTFAQKLSGVQTSEQKQLAEETKRQEEAQQLALFNEKNQILLSELGVINKKHSNMEAMQKDLQILTQAQEEESNRRLEELKKVEKALKLTLAKQRKEQLDRQSREGANRNRLNDERKKNREDERLRQARLERERLANEEQVRIGEEARRKRLENDAIAAFNKYAPRIRQKVTKNWNQVTQKSLKTGVIVEIDRSGGVQSVTITESSGSNEFDRSVSLAIRKASPLPIPDNADYYEYIRKFRFVFDSREHSS